MIIKDGRTLRAICNKYGFEFDKQYKYITKDNNHIGKIEWHGREYKLKYFDGCFYPYMVETQ